MPCAESTANVDERLIIHKSDEAKRRIDEATTLNLLFKKLDRETKQHVSILHVTLFCPTSHDILLTSCDMVYLG